MHDNQIAAGAEPDTALTLARALIHFIGVEDAWWSVVREGGDHELLVEINRWRRWQRRRERRSGR